MLANLLPSYPPPRSVLTIINYCFKLHNILEQLFVLLGIEIFWQINSLKCLANDLI